EALVEWFPGHANSMDAGLVAYLQEKGYDTSAEAFHAGPPKAGEAGEAATLACTHHAPGESCA
ncbi:hypothetical protein P3G55_25170, partial [Leptospira sp. 96542]|nr:hypothetical protein [Leptospira sp. 96542]